MVWKDEKNTWRRNSSNGAEFALLQVGVVEVLVQSHSVAGMLHMLITVQAVNEHIWVVNAHLTLYVNWFTTHYSFENDAIITFTYKLVKGARDRLIKLVQGQSAVRCQIWDSGLRFRGSVPETGSLRQYHSVS